MGLIWAAAPAAGAGRRGTQKAGAQMPQPSAGRPPQLLRRAGGEYSPRRSECSAAWLAHQTGGLGVGGSNPPTPTSGPPGQHDFAVPAADAESMSSVSNAQHLVYSIEPALPVDEFLHLLRQSGLAERRPVADEARIERMLRNANLIVTARLDRALVGVARRSPTTAIAATSLTWRSIAPCSIAALAPS